MRSNYLFSVLCSVCFAGWVVIFGEFIRIVDADRPPDLEAVPGIILGGETTTDGVWIWTDDDEDDSTTDTLYLLEPEDPDFHFYSLETGRSWKSNNDD